MSKTNNKVIKRDMSTFNIVFTVIVVLINVLFAYVSFNLTQYSGLSKFIFIVLNIFILIVLLALNLIFIITIRTRKSNMFNVFVALCVILFGVGSYGTYAMVSVNTNIDKIIDEGSTSETIETSLVVYSDSGEFLIKEEADLEGKTLGVVTGSNNYDLAKKQLETNKIKVSYAEFTDNNELLLALFNGEINAAALPSNYVGIFEVNDGYDVLLEDTKVISTFSSVVEVKATVGSDKDITKEPFTVLVLGVDEGRSDAVILVSVNPISMKITMSSIARDSYVPIACYGGNKSDKLGHARVQSRQCTIDTVSKLVGVPIDYYFESNFKGIVEMVDALGGIVVN
ncbi:MAG: LCP family protein, partial [Erysipelotrichaceae bacterium]